MWYLYLIRCRDQSLYTGITTDPDRRFNEHQNSPKGARYLRGKGPLTLVFTAPVGTRSQALKLERQIKRWPKVKKEALVSGALDLGA